MSGIPISKPPIDESSYFSQPRKNRFRLSRFSKHIVPIIEHIFHEKGRVKILDMGGMISYWDPLKEEIEKFNCHITFLNMSIEDCCGDRAPNEKFSIEVGDGRRCNFPTNSFDFMHSNSTLEHAGNWRDMQAMAKEMRRLSQIYYVQVPYFWFPIEPHFRLPFFHWLPEQVRAKIIMRRGFGFMSKAESVTEAVEAVQSAQLLDVAQMRALFPDAHIERERMVGISKSIIAMKFG
ncbi:MAG TPA: class I SAM-dependent methyltransferase [Rhizomicrobium sp.]|nr:class I SAM-dependent methyltransferase [Rhizomicrobium sp.]